MRREIDAFILTGRGTFMKGSIIDEGGQSIQVNIKYGEGRRVPTKGELIAIKDILIPVIGVK